MGTAPALAQERDHRKGKEKTLYIWAGDQAHKAPDFLAVIDFDEESADYGKVIKTVPLPPPGNIGNEAHHCHLNSTGKLLGCGGLLSVLKGQNGIFFFDVSEARNPRFLFSAKAVESSITDDFLPTENGGFLITQMGVGRRRSPRPRRGIRRQLHFVGNHFGEISMFQEFPKTPPVDGFNPHGISARPDLNVMMTSDFILPSSTLTGSRGPELARFGAHLELSRSADWPSTINLVLARRRTRAGHHGREDAAQGSAPVSATPRGCSTDTFTLIDPVAGTGVAAFDWRP